MNSLLARLGHLETRRTAQTIWNDGKRKRRDWVCAGCKARRALRQRRCYSDDSLTIPGQFWGAGRHARDEQVGNRDADEFTSRAEKAEFTPIAAEGDLSEDTKRKLRSIDSNALGSPDPRALLRKARPNNFFSHQEPTVDSGTASSAHEQTALWEQFEMAERDQDADRLAPDADASDHLDTLTMPADELLNLDYKQDFLRALAKKEVDLLIRCLFSAVRADDMDFIRAIPESTFTDIIRILEPKNFVAKIANAHIELSSAIVENMGVTPMREAAYEYSIVLRRIAKIRRQLGFKLTLEDYRLLLRAARDLGAGPMNRVMWLCLDEDGLKPDTKCYNYYMSSIVWKGCHNAGSRHKVRVIPFHMLARSGRAKLTPVSQRRFQNYSVGDGGVREQVMKVFNQMLANGALADEESFRILITACAREGDVDTVKAILRKVWRVDVDAIMDGKKEEDMIPRHFDETSSLRPTSHLLFTLAHCFGINNNIPTALRVVDFVARHYQLSIHEDTWAQLFEWTFVLSIRRNNSDKLANRGTKAGFLPTRSPQSLWETMTGAPYFIQPSLGMYNMLIKNVSRHRSSTAILKKMREAFQIIEEQRQKGLQSLTHLKQLLAKEQTGQDMHHESVESARQEYEYNELIRKRNSFWAKRWIRILLSMTADTFRQDPDFAFSARHLPGLLWDLRYFCPRTVRYETPTGLIEFELRQQEELEWRRARYEEHQRASKIILKASRRYVGDEWVFGSPERDLQRAEEIVAQHARKNAQPVRSAASPITSLNSSDN